MSNEYNHSIQFDLDHLTQYEDVSDLEEKKEELDEVYAQIAKVDENEAKAKILDRVKEFAEEPPFLLANNENEDYERYAYDQILKLINRYEIGQSE